MDILDKNGYDTSEDKEFGMEHIAVMMEHNQMNLFLEKKDKSKKIYVKYSIQGKMSPAELRNLADEFFVEPDPILTKNDDLMIITKEDPNDSTTEMLDLLWTEGIFITIVGLKRLQFNILNHVQVPPHRILSKEEQDLLMTKYNIRLLSELPVISRYDPVAIMIGLRPNMICEIERKSKTAIKSLYYRACV
jgi:DNA-directed RNA polymerase subunit H